jgi:hypothetical protein
MTHRAYLIIACLCGIILAQWVPATPIGLPWLPSVVTLKKPTKATYVYEQRAGSVPSAVLSALNTLNRSGIVATPVDQHVLGGGDSIPAQYVVAMEEAKKAGIPCLVVEYSTGPPKVVKAPTTAEQVLESAK